MIYKCETLHFEKVKMLKYIHTTLKLKKGFYCHLERQILWEPNQVRVLPKWELKRVYWNLIRVKDFTLKFRAHAGDLMVMMRMAKNMVLSRRLLLSMVSDINKSKKCVNKKQRNQ